MLRLLKIITVSLVGAAILSFMVIQLDRYFGLSSPPTAKYIPSSGNRETKPMSVDYTRPCYMTGKGYDYPTFLGGKVVGQIQWDKPVLAYHIAELIRRDGHFTSWTLVKADGYAAPIWTRQCEEPFSDEVKKWPKRNFQHFNMPPLEFKIPTEYNATGSSGVQGVVHSNIEVIGYEEPLGELTGSAYYVMPGRTAVKAVARYKFDNFEGFLVTASGCRNLVWVPQDQARIKWHGFEKGEEKTHLARLPQIESTLHLNKPFPKPLLEPEPSFTKIKKPNSAHKIYVRTESGDKHPWHDKLPPLMKAEIAQDADMLVTIRLVPQVGEKCNYGIKGSGIVSDSLIHSAILIRETVSARLSLQDMNKIIAEKTFAAPLKSCPTKMAAGSSYWIKGEPPNPQPFNDWIEEIVKN